MGESSKKKRTAKKSTSSKKVSAAAKMIVKKKKAAVKPVTRKAAKKITFHGNKTLLPQAAALKTSTTEIPLPRLQHADIKDRVEDAKYSPTPVIQKFQKEKGFELPFGYNESRITIMVRDPHWLHSYWELPDWKIEELKSTMGHAVFSRSKRIVRVYDVTDIKFTGVNANKSFDIEVGGDARNWYINTGEPGRSYCVDIGYLTPEGKFFVIARSNVVSTPLDGMSDVIDEEWLTIDWDRIYAMSGGFGIGRSSGEIRELLKRRLKEEMSSGAVSSWGASGFKKPLPAEKDFWLVVNTDLIVYGATEPDAKVSMQGLPIKLRPDGTFSMRFALPDGRQDIPVVAVNKDGDMRRQITPAVEKRTK
ncbi:MAG: DUF4912 domain-containing protein [Candidatus Margulisiibacteriota bacterium]